jgi:hypothetical protein
MCFVWISKQTAIISLYDISWLAFIAETESLQRGTALNFKYNRFGFRYNSVHPCLERVNVFSRWRIYFIMEFCRLVK